MEIATSLLGLAAAWVVIVLSPGPCFLTVMQRVTVGTRRDGVLCAVGIACGTLVWCLGSALGLAVLLSAWSWLADLVRLLGAVYLAWLGVKTLRSAGAGGVQPTAPGLVARRSGGWRDVRAGLLVDLGNPKAAFFFTSLFATFIPADTPAWLWGVTIAEVIVIELAWYMLVASLFANAAVRGAYQRARRGIDVVVGSLFLLLAGKLALDR